MPKKPTHSPIPISAFIPDLGSLQIQIPMEENSSLKCKWDPISEENYHKKLKLKLLPTNPPPSNPELPQNYPILFHPGTSPTPKIPKLKLKKLARVKSLTQTNAPTRNSFGQRRRAFPSPLLFHEDPCLELPWVCPCHSNSLSEDASPKCVFLK